MRVAFLTHNFPRYAGDASGSFLLRLAVALRDANVDVRVFAPAAAGYPSRDVVDGVDVNRFRYAPRRLETIAYTGTMAHDARASWSGRAALAGLLAAGANATRQAVRQWKADVVHAHWWFPSGLAAAPSLVRARAPLVVTLHGSDIRLAVGVAPARTLLAHVARRASALTAVSRWLCAQATAIVPGVGCDVAPMPAATDLFRPEPRGPRDGLLFVGRLNTQKGLDRLLRAVAIQRHPGPLTVVGDGPDASTLHDLCASLGLADRVHWHAPVSQTELAEFYRRARALVVPSTDEGLGLVAAEALLCETPVIAFASGGLPDVVNDGVTGWLVEPGNVMALASALDAVNTSPRLAEMGRAGRVAAATTFAPSAVASRYRALYERALGTAAPAR